MKFNNDFYHQYHCKPNAASRFYRKPKDGILRYSFCEGFNLLQAVFLAFILTPANSAYYRGC